MRGGASEHVRPEEGGDGSVAQIRSQPIREGEEGEGEGGEEACGEVCGEVCGEKCVGRRSR